MHQRLMQRQERRGAQADGDLPDSPWTEDERRQSTNQPVAQREVRRPLATTTKHDQLLLEHEILGDHGSHATGPHSFAVTTAKCSKVITKFFMRESA
jgi:hypothetical protein